MQATSGEERGHERNGETGGDTGRENSSWAAIDPFRTTFHQAPIGLAHVAPDGAWLAVNDRLCEIVGYTRDELLKLSFQDITYPADLEADIANVRQMLAGEIDRYQIEKRYQRKDGSLIWALLTVSLVREEGTDTPLFFVSAVEDIHARKRVEAALRDSEQQLRALHEGIKEFAMFLFDAQGVILSWNPGVGRVLGWDEAGIVGQHVGIIFTPEDRAMDIPELEMAIAAREGRAADERWHVRRDGSRFFASGVVESVHDSETGMLVGFTKVLTDATERRESERRLAQKAALIDLASDAILVHEPRTNCITLWSRGAETLYGWAREEVVGKVASELLRTEFPEGMDYDGALATLLREGYWEGDLIHTDRDGRRLIVASRWALQRDTRPGTHESGPGDLIAVLEVNREVTAERVRAEAQRVEIEQQRQIAHALQHALLLAPPPDAFPGLTVKPLYEPAYDDALIGGDFYDVFAVEEDRIALVVGDVTGKGLAAATFTAELKFALRAFLREYPHPPIALHRLNAFVADKERLDPLHLGGSYVALALCVVNTRTREMRCACAGIEPPFLVHAATGQATELWECNGPLLGIEARSRYEEQRMTLAEGDVLAMSTDGLTEARPARRGSQRRELFGYGRLVQAVCEEVQRHPGSLADAGMAVANRARQFAGGTINDDVCLLLARYLGATPPVSE